MILSTLTKFGIGGSTVAWALALVERTPVSYSTEQNRTTFDKEITIKTLDDVELLESKHGCTFSFIQSFDNNKAYRVKKFFEEANKEKNNTVDWNKAILWATDNWKSRCKPGEFIPLAYNSGTPQKFFIKGEEN